MDLAKEIRERKENRKKNRKGGFAVEGVEKPLKTRKIEGIGVGMISRRTDDKRAVRSKAKHLLDSRSRRSAIYCDPIYGERPVAGGMEERQRRDVDSLAH